MPDVPRSKLAVLLHADVAGSTALVELDQALAHERMRDAFRRLAETIADHRGVPHEVRGDALVAEFSKVSDAVGASTAFQLDNTARNDVLVDDVRPLFRVGIAMGEVIVADGTITGAGVVLAQRLEQLAEPGGVCIQAAAYETVPKRLRLAYENLGECELKGFDEPIRVYAIKDAVPPRTKTGTPKPAQAPSIAVLPFVNMSGDPEQEYFADGISEDIITELSKIPGLLVISRNSTFTYKGKAAKVQDVCRDLGVGHVLEGSVRKAGQRVRITAQLINGISGGHLWAERYDRTLADIFAVQDEVTERIVQALEVNLVANFRDRPARGAPDNPETYDLVLRGREQYRLFSKEGNRNARRLYEQAIEIDPACPEAYAGLAEVCLHEWFQGSAGALDRAYELALQANSLNPSLPLVYEALGNVHLFKREHDEALAALRRWIEIEPGNADAYANLAGALQFSGEPQKVFPLVEKAIRLNPFYPFYYVLYQGQAYLTLERYEDALQALKRAAARNAQALPAHLYLAACYGLLGEHARAREALAVVHRIAPEFSTSSVRTYFPYRRAIDSDRLLDGLRTAGLSE